MELDSETALRHTAFNNGEKPSPQRGQTLHRCNARQGQARSHTLPSVPKNGRAVSAQPQADLARSVDKVLHGQSESPEGDQVGLTACQDIEMQGQYGRKLETAMKTADHFLKSGRRRQDECSGRRSETRRRRQTACSSRAAVPDGMKPSNRKRSGKFPRIGREGQYPCNGRAVGFRAARPHGRARKSVWV